ncbi:MAG: HEAT repeat domain-containing protein [Myxococcaceae bacterium]
MGGLRLGPGLGVALYVLLVASAGLAFFGRRYPGRLPVPLETVTPWVFAVFIACFAVYRFGLANARKYPASKAFFQVGLAVVVFLLLLPSSRAPYVPAGTALGQALADPDPRLRALAAEVARYRPDGRGYVPTLVQALSDPDPTVRAQAHASLVSLTGVDLGSPEAPGAVDAWRRRYP